VAQPTARLEVAGADGLQEYPPKAMTGYETYMEGHGVFKAYANSEENGAAWKAFNKTDATGEGWVTDQDEFVLDTGYSNTSTSTTNTVFGSCSFLALETPSLIKLEKIRIQPDVNSSGAPDSHDLGMPKDFQIWARRRGTDWTQIAGYYDQTFPSLTGSTEYYDVNATDYYSEFAIAVTRTHTSSSYSWTSGTSQYSRGSIGEWRLFGTPAPSSLEDGHLTLGKALTAPRLSGHGAGAETPRAESLVVHYDTTVDSVVAGSTVVDTSGNGRNGTLTNEAVYSSTERALTFDGVNDYVKGSIPSSLAGNHTYSFSMWVKPDAIQAGYIATFEMGLRTVNRSSGLYLRDGKIVHLAFGNNLETTTYIVVGQWIHIVGTYTSGSRKVYADGVLLGSDAYSSMNIGSTEMTLGANNDDDQEFNGSISNFKLYNVALTAEEVAQEYALGRTGKSLNVTDTAVCLGGTVPRAQLDVRGSAFASKYFGGLTTFLTGDYTSTAITSFTGVGQTITMVQYTFNVPQEYHLLGRANLESQVMIKWCGEIDISWNFMFYIDLYHSGLSTPLKSAANTDNSGSRGNGAGVPVVNHHYDYGSTMESAMIGSRFYIPNCDVSPGSTFTVNLVGARGSYATAATVYTNRTKNDTNNIDHERGITNFFMALRVV